MSRPRVLRILGLVALTTVLPIFQNCQMMEGGIGKPFKVDETNLLSEGDLSSANPKIQSVVIPSLSNLRDQTLTFVAVPSKDATLVSVQCKLDDQLAQDCLAQSLSMTNLTDGAHAVLITIADSESKEASFTVNFRIDATPPIASFGGTPGGTSGPAKSFEFTATDATSTIASFECSLDNSLFSTCTSPRAYTNLAPGMHNFRVRAKDLAGNTSVEISQDWNVNPAAPALVISGMPAANSNSQSATFTFSATQNSQNLTMFECSLDAATFAACSSPTTYNGLAQGLHNFKLRVRDLTNQLSEVVEHNWRVDTVAPVLTFTATPPALGTATTANFTWTTTDTNGSGVAAIECQLDTQAFVACASPRSLANLAAGTHTFRVRARDAAANAGMTEHTWMIEVPIDGAALYISNCQGCHGALANSTVRRKTAMQITNALDTIPAMDGLRGTLSPAQISAISAYLQ